VSETTASNAPLLSVRGEARQTVAPDSVTLVTALNVTADTKPEALRKAAIALDALTAALRELGGTPLTAESERAAFTWSAYSATTHVEKQQDPQTGHHTGPERVYATVAVIMTLREFAVLDRLGEVLAGHEPLAIHQTIWNVDADNPAWKAVRADAIYSAIAKGRDYAAALGGSLTEVLHIADVGLLGGDGGSGRIGPTPMAMRAMAASAGSQPGAPSLDPVPQEVAAAIEARFTMTAIGLGEA
jgi:hypothetical protein